MSLVYRLQDKTEIQDSSHLKQVLITKEQVLTMYSRLKESKETEQNTTGFLYYIGGLNE